MTEKFLKPIEEIKPCIQEVLWILSRINMKEKNISRQIIVKLLKTIAKRENYNIRPRELLLPIEPQCLPVDFLTETMESRRYWNDDNSVQNKYYM